MLPHPVVILGLDPRIHFVGRTPFRSLAPGVDPRVKPEDDGVRDAGLAAPDPGPYAAMNSFQRRTM